MVHRHAAWGGFTAGDAAEKALLPCPRQTAAGSETFDYAPTFRSRHSLDTKGKRDEGCAMGAKGAVRAELQKGTVSTAKTLQACWIEKLHDLEEQLLGKMEKLPCS